MPRACLLIAVLVSLTCETTLGQAPAAERLLRAADVRAAGMGDAFGFARRAGYSGGPDVAALFVHPSATLGSGGVSAAFARYSGGAHGFSVASGLGWMGGQLSVGMRALSSEADAFVAVLGYARRIRGVAVGATVHLVDERAGGDHAAIVAGDVGVSGTVAGVRVALSARSLGPGLDLPRGTGALPTDVALGVASGSVEAGPLDLVVASQLVRRRDGSWIPGGGIEVSWWPVIGRTFTGRIGARRPTPESTGTFTFGLGFTGDVLSIDWALQPGDGPMDGHRFGLSWR